MSGENLFRKAYPAILNLTIDQVHRFATNDETLDRWLRVYRDLQLLRERSTVVGWNPGANPFAGRRLSSDAPKEWSGWTESHSNFTEWANGWFGIGIWAVAERYYKLVIEMAASNHDGIAALFNATNLGLCYLGSQDYDSAIHLCNHLLEVTPELNGFLRSSVGAAAATELRIALIDAGRAEEIPGVNRRIRSMEANWLSPDDSVFRMLASVFEATSNSVELQRWQRRWATFVSLANR